MSATDHTTDRILDDLRRVVDDAEGLMRETAGVAGERAADARARAAESLRVARERLQSLEDELFSRARDAARDTDRYLRHYSRRFQANNQSFDQFAAQKRQVNAGKDWIKVKTDNLSVFRNPGKEEVVVVTFDQDYRSNNLSNVMKKRQYWIREDGRWKIIYEGAA